MRPTFHYFALLLLAITLSVTACREDPAQPTGQGNVKIEFEHVVGAESLQLNERNYTNALGQSYTVSQFMYYVSNFSLTRRDGSVYQVPESYFLIDEENAVSRTITLNDIPAGDYTALTFVIGVDSTRNTSGAQTGALDPVNGMFWSWNTGYIFVRLEGTSPASPQPYNKLQYHVGGFKGATNCIRTVSPALNGNLLQVRAGKSPQVHYRVNAATLFTGTTPVDFTQEGMTAVHGGANAVKLADNYHKGLFTFDHLHNDEQ